MAPHHLRASCWALDLGARYRSGCGTSFKVWGPRCSHIAVKILKGRKFFCVPMRKDAEGYFCALIRGVQPGDRYFYRPNDQDDRPDPVSRFQPEGVHGASCVMDPAGFGWTDRDWKGIPFSAMIFYELHVGTFTPQGTFEAALRKIPYLKHLGVTCVEVMPVAQFPGRRNWGYDGVGLYAVQNSYGGPAGLKKFVNACHNAGLAVCLDVVYNHFGPEGNYLHSYGPYFTKKHQTPWGDAVNYDGPSNRHVRRFITDNALYWITEYHMDALRLDAIHGIFDSSKKHILQELNEKVKRQAAVLGRQVYVIAESDLNDSRIIRPVTQKGYGLAGQWSDDFHHAVHAYLTGERSGYYRDFGKLADVVKSLKDGFVYDGRYSLFRGRRHGNPVKDLDPRKLVTCVQNHDQVGNRAYGERLSALADFKREKLAAVLLLLSPNTPLLFMGQEYGEKAPFQYFVDHGDPALIRAVREGRTQEFRSFGWKKIPAPDAKRTYQNSRLRWHDKGRGKHRALWRFYRDLMVLRKKLAPSFRLADLRFSERDRWLCLFYKNAPRRDLAVVLSFNEKGKNIPFPFEKNFSEILNTEYVKYGGCAAKAHFSRQVIWLPPQSACIGQI